MLSQSTKNELRVSTRLGFSLLNPAQFYPKYIYEIICQPFLEQVKTIGGKIVKKISTQQLKTTYEGLRLTNKQIYSLKIKPQLRETKLANTGNLKHSADLTVSLERNNVTISD